MKTDLGIVADVRTASEPQVRSSELVVPRREKQNKRRNLYRWETNRLRRLRATPPSELTARQRKRINQLQASIISTRHNACVSDGAAKRL